MKAFKTYADDIYVVTYPKSGTTLCQVILFQMLNNGKVNFDHVNDVSPWIRNEVFKNNPVKKIKGRRVIKSHDYYKLFPRSHKGKIVYIYRNGCDVCASLFHQKRNYNNPELTFQKHFEDMFGNGSMNWFRFNKDWFVNKRNYKILYLSYDQLIEDKRNSIIKLADFLNIDQKSFNIDTVLNLSSFDYMKENEQKFGEKPPAKPDKIYDNFIRKGVSGEGKAYLNTEQLSFFEKNMKVELQEMVDKTFSC
tara:strand:- start:1375 stop:2124 length:750 start_codon:yes stop_codon:yes gene_type:complete